MNDVFELTDEHIALLRHMFVGWQDCETGAPEIDPKRPYGNSNVPDDIVEILGWKVIRDDDELSDVDSYAAMHLHKETATALQIILCTGSFVPGWYEKTSKYNDTSWALIPEHVVTATD